MPIVMNSTGLIDYTLTPNPDPINASPITGSPEKRSLALTVRGRTIPAWCSEITLAIPYGDDEGDLTPEDRLGDIGKPILPHNNWEEGPGSPRKNITDQTYVYTFIPNRPKPVQIASETTLVFTIPGIEINKTPGEFTVTVTETTSDTETGSYTVKTSPQTMEKFGVGFLFNNLHPDKALVDNGDTVKLAWNARNAKITVYWAGDTYTFPDNPTTPLEWTSPPLTEATAFLVEAYDTTGTGTRKHVLTTTVFVDLPDLNLGNLTVTGITKLLGEMTVEGNISIIEKAGEHRGIITPRIYALPGGHILIESLTVTERGIQVNGDVRIIDEDGAYRGIYTPRLYGESQPGTISLKSRVNAEHEITSRASISTSNGIVVEEGDVEVRDGDVVITNSPFHGLVASRIYKNPEASALMVKDAIEFVDTVEIKGAIEGVSAAVKPGGWGTSWNEDEGGDRQAPTNQVMVGRSHRGDENEPTWHKYASIEIRGPKVNPNSSPNVNNEGGNGGEQGDSNL